ncbi:hypothetical protein [Hoeflea sp.]|uniref:hypothetical protein n=1 Tax=Hoeflea sp. TaxID=1940281 RepID=UPI003B52C836
MVDWSSLEHANLDVQRHSRSSQAVLSEAHELGLLSAADMRGKLSAKVKAFVREWPDLDEVRSWRFVIESALEERCTPTFVGECLLKLLLPRSTYNMSLSKKEFLSDILSLLEERDAVCCLAVYRSMHDIGRSNRFVPPAGIIVDRAFAEESDLQSVFSDTLRVEKLIVGLC